MLHLILLSLVAVAAVSSTFASTPIIYDSGTTYEDSVSQVAEPVPEEQVLLYPELVPICGCESVGNKDAIPRHFNSDGTVLRGHVDPRDTGMCQINTHYWLETANELGFDIETEQGNIKMANWIYDQSGPKPWKWSAGCHGQY
jgi:hypothetical protein